MNIEEIMEHLPHRYPFLLVDRVLDVEKGKRLTALKNVTMNEPYFVGHFPNNPVMPGVMIIEALAQASGVLAFLSAEGKLSADEFTCYLVAVDKARFRKKVTPGDQLRLETELEVLRSRMAKFSARALVMDEEVCSVTLSCILA